ncbi:DUF11 domain-containing protein [Nodosilinea sp. LEGE 07088]|uniref:DUF11 domain-containing protein n=1 Tax=Nodosilinea sp. LEGE 07088 TaxID=2777968 RepID=UPI00187F83EF|nr:DUF11 domain-containing protein [Nodosilinea sp. LEGE 07088]MBE9139050.1 DUF11 domain-containing protein [Nodosilinea sp. LEGE 07088]
MCQSSQIISSPAQAEPRHSSGFGWVRLLSSLMVMVFVLTWAYPAQAQVAVDQLITTDVPAAVTTPFPASPFANPCDDDTVAPIGFGFPGCPAGTIPMTFGTGLNRVLTEVDVAGNRFERATNLSVPPVVPDRVEFRRVGLAPGGLAARQLLFYEQVPNTVGNVSNPLNIGPELIVENPAVETIATAMLSPVVNRGIDNVFNNVTLPANNQDTRNNIERIDYIIGNGALVDPNTISLDDVGFLVLERGGNDNFRIAPITGFDPGTGLPTAYGNLVAVDAADWGGNGDIGVNLRSAVLRKDDPAFVNPAFRPTHTVPNQNVRGVYVPLSTLLPATNAPVIIFGFSLFANDVTNAFNLLNFASFPQTTNGTDQGGLDLVAGGFGLVRRTTPTVPTGNVSLLKRITNLFGPANLPNFAQVVGDGAALALLQNNGLGQGLATITDPTVTGGNGIEYTVYFANTSPNTAANVTVCDQIPATTTFVPDSFGAGTGIQAIASSSPAGPTITYTNAADGDAGRYIAPGAALPAFCGVNQGNGAVVVEVGNVAASQVGLIRFRTTVN